MIGERESKMLRCGLAALGKDWADSRIFYCIGKHRTQEEMSLACQRLHDTPFLPWPDDNCVIITENWPFPDMLNIVGRIRKTNSVKNIHVGMRGKVTGSCSGFAPGPSLCTLMHNQVSLDADINKARGIEQMLDKAFGSPKTPIERELYQRAKGALPRTPIRTYWGVGEVEWSHIVSHLASGSYDAFPRICSGIHVLYALANKATACGYRIVGKMREGYGPPSMKKRTRGREILFLVSLDRTYNKREKGEEQDERCPLLDGHPRQGHYRYQWKRDAGLSLPSHSMSVIERDLLARKHNIQPVYVSPCWVGPPEWSDNGWDFRIRMDGNPD